MATRKSTPIPEAQSEVREPELKIYTAFAIIKAGPEFILVQHEIDELSNTIHSTVSSKPMSYFMAVYTQKQKAAAAWI